VIQLYCNIDEASKTAGEAVPLMPVAFNGFFGWLHRPSDNLQREIAVVLCQGVMREGLLGYCSVRLLGEDLAAAGYPTLRFDYPATGNSLDAGLNDSGAHWTAWQDSIEAAIDWLRAASGARRVVLGGVLTGATLAALVAPRRKDVAGLLLFEPPVVGRTYVRQLILEADLERGEATLRDQGLEIREMRFSPETLAQMARFDLRQVALLPGQKAAIFHRPELKPMADCAKAWAKRGNDATSHGFKDLMPLLHHEMRNEGPLADFTRPLAWLKQAVPQGPPSTTPISRDVAVLQPPGCIDTPMRFGPDNRLFGMLCRPDRGSTDDILLISNGGRDPSFGSARQSVVLARRLAQAGIASLRFDFSGLGDSLGLPGQERVFPDAFTDRVSDTKAAIDAMAALGFSRIGIHGLCVGAYHALYGALADERLSALIMINLPLFTLPASNTLGQREQRGQSARSFLGRLARPSTWRHLLGGRSDRPMPTRGAVFPLRRHTIGRLRRLALRLGLAASQTFAHLAMADLSRRGVRTLYLFSDGPQDIQAFAAEFGPNGEKLTAHPGAEMRIVPGMDRSLTITAGRVPAETMIVEFIAAGRRADAAAPAAGKSIPV
jgi:alpha-beta hydrolase superfamily lysophospholipase